MKKTLLVTIDFPPADGGVSTYWNNVCQSFPSDKLVVLTLPNKSADSNQFNCKVVRISLMFKFIWPHWIKGVFQIYKVYKKEGCEQIMVGQILPVGAMVYYLNKFVKIPYHLQLYGMDLLMARRVKRKFELAQKVLDSAEKVFVNTNVIGSMAQNYTNKNIDTVVIYPVPAKFNPVNQDVKEELIKKNNLQGKKVILTLGRLVPRKGQDTTLGSMLHVWQKHPNAVYVIAGDGVDKPRLEVMAEPHKDRVILTGRVSEEEKNAWLDICDVFSMPARETPDDVEGFGIVYLEANQHSKPVIGGRSGGVVEAVIDGETGLLVDPEEVDDIAKAIMKLLDDPDYAKQLGEKGLKRLETFTWANSVKKFISEL